MKPIHSATIIKEDGIKLETKDHDIYIRSVSIPSVNVEPQFEEIPGSTRQHLVGTKITREPIEFAFDFKANDRGGFSLLRNEIFNLFHSRKPFYFIDPIEKGKRFQVMASGFRPEEVGTLGRSSVDLVPVQAYAESLGTTAGPFTEDSGLWAYGMGLDESISEADYIKTVATFDINNRGDFTVDSREHELLIQLVSKGGTGTNLAIKNFTNNDTWTYTGAFSGGDRIAIEGINTEKNGTNVDGDTNLGLIRLEPGDNRIFVSGIVGEFEIRFVFRFLYN